MLEPFIKSSDHLLDELKRLAHPDLPSCEVDKDQFYWSYPWRKLSQRVKERDNYECQVCKSKGRLNLGTDSKGSKLGKGLIVHHIKPIEFYPSERLKEDNLITVCLECHNSIHFITSESARWNDEWW